MSAAHQTREAISPILRVSPDSLYGDDRWQLARGIIGHHDAEFTIDWSFAMPDNSRFNDERWHHLRNASKRLLWSLHSDPPTGRRAATLRTLATHASRLRIILQWMAANGIARWANLDERVIECLFADLCERPGIHGAGLSASTGYGYLGLIQAFYHQRLKVPDAPVTPPPMLARLGRWRDEQRWPYTPDDIAVPLLAGALHLIGDPADAIIAMRDTAQAYYDGAMREGLTREAGQMRARKYLRGHPAIELRTGAPVRLAASPIEALNARVARVYDACFVTIAYLIGARASEILGLEAGCIEWGKGEDGERYGYVLGTIRKGAPGEHGLPHRWIAPEPVMRAITVLERLSAPWRAIDGRKLLWLTQAAPASALRSSGLAIQPVSINAVNARLNCRLAPLIGLPDHQGSPWHLASHQGRKTFARFVGRRDRTGLGALAKHLGHVTRAMTDRSYVGTDFELGELVDGHAAAETRAALEELLTAPRLAGKAGRTLAQRSPFRGRTRGGGLDIYITQLLAETDMRLGVCDWGYCLYRRETSACLGSEREPNPVLRTQATCSTCANFVVSDKHRPVWEARLLRNSALVERADLDPESRALAEERIAESRRILDDLDRQNGDNAAR